MALKKTTCVNHPDRPAMGVCVITRDPICAECSTQYEGVNYSKEGLRILMEQRRTESEKIGGGERLIEIIVMTLSPVCLYLLYLFYYYSFQAFIDLSL